MLCIAPNTQDTKLHYLIIVKVNHKKVMTKSFFLQKKKKNHNPNLKILLRLQFKVKNEIICLKSTKYLNF